MTIAKPFILTGEIPPLVILWIHAPQEKRVAPLNLSVEGHQVRQPLFIMGLEQSDDYLVAAWVEPESAPRRAAGARRSASPQLTLTSHNGLSFSARLTGKAALPWLQQVPPVRMAAVRHGLIDLLPKLIKSLPETCLARLHDSLGMGSVDLQVLSDGRFYFRFPQPLGRHLPTTARLIPTDTALEAVPVAVRQTGGFVHVLSQQPLPAAWPGKNTRALLRADNSSLWPLMLKKPVKLRDEMGLAEGFFPIASASTRSAILRLEGDVLRGYCLDAARPYDILTLETYLDGEYQARIEANQGGIRFEDKPLNCGWSWVLPAAALDGADHVVDLVRVDTQERLAGCPYPLGADRFDHEFHLEDGRQLWGILRPRGYRAQPPDLAVKLDGDALTVTPVWQPQPADHGVLAWRVEIALPPLVNDGKPHALTVEMLEGERVLAESGLDYQAHYVGRLERLDQESVSGWLYQKEAPHRAVTLDVVIDEEVVAQVSARRQTSTPIRLNPAGDAIACGFSVRLGAADLSQTSRSVGLRIAGTSTEVFGPARVFTPYDVILGTLMHVQASLHGEESRFALANGLETTATATRWVREQIMAPLIARLRQQPQIPARLSLDLNLADTLSPASYPPLDETVVDIIVPVYEGMQETLLCLRSLLDQTPAHYALIVINDASPNAALVQVLRQWAATGAFTLLENERNQGFVASVNRGMQCHPERDVVLLNADTIVPAGWLPRLQAAARSAANIATATPFSNNATLLSFPEPFIANPLPEGEAFETLADHFARCNAGVVMDIPTGVGFCLYIRRAALNAVGLFDAEGYRTGYGEENDFCLRAQALGWRHVAACDVYVAHQGSVSFGDGKEKLLAQNLATLTSRFPDYLTTIDRFEQQDVLRRVRNPVARHLLKAKAEAYLLFITHELAGGIKTHTDDLISRLARQGVEVLLLTANAQGHCSLGSPAWPHGLSYGASTDDWACLLDDLAELGVYHVHYHHVLHFPAAIWTLPDSLSVAYDVTLHDYYLVCPTINLIDETGGYCGNSQWEAAHCNRCLRINSLDRMNPGLNLQRQFGARGGTMEAWRSFHGAFLQKARRVFAPSRAVADIVQGHYALSNLSVKPHPEQPWVIDPDAQALSPPYRIAVIGAIGLHKGYSLLLECARSALKNDLPLEFVVFGYTLHDGYFDDLENVSLMGAYAPDELHTRLLDSGCVLAAFFSPWPETFGYTLSEAWRAGLYPVAFDLGALAERIRATGYGSVIAYTREAREINANLLAMAEAQARSPMPSGFSVGMDYPDILADYYELATPPEGRPQ